MLSKSGSSFSALGELGLHPSHSETVQVTRAGLGNVWVAQGWPAVFIMTTPIHLQAPLPATAATSAQTSQIRKTIFFSRGMPPGLDFPLDPHSAAPGSQCSWQTVPHRPRAVRVRNPGDRRGSRAFRRGVRQEDNFGRGHRQLAGASSFS